MSSREGAEYPAGAAPSLNPNGFPRRPQVRSSLPLHFIQQLPPHGPQDGPGTSSGFGARQVLSLLSERLRGCLVSCAIDLPAKSALLMGLAGALPTWASEPCIMGIDEAGRGPVLGPMVYGCLYCARSYQKTLASLNFADSKTLKEEKREELFENLKLDDSIGWGVDVIDPRELSAKMLQKNKINLNEISHSSAIGLVKKVLGMGFLLTEVYVDTVGDPEKYRVKLCEIFPGIKFVVAKKADSLYPVVSGASIVAKVTRDRALRNWVFDETAEHRNRKFGSGYPGDPETKAWLDHHKHSVFGFPTLVRFSWGTCTAYSKEIVEVVWESDKMEEDGSKNGNGKRQLKLSGVGFTGCRRKSEETESSGKGRSKFFLARKLELVTKF